jgi:hypothetical protein
MANNSDVESQLRDARAKTSEYERGVSEAVGKGGLFENELARAREQLYNNRMNLERQKEVVAGLADQIAAERAKITRELQNQKLHDLAHMNQAVKSEEDLEAERCAALIDDLQRQNDAKAKAIMDELRRAYEHKLDEYRNQLEQLGHDVAVLRDQERNARDMEESVALLLEQIRTLNDELAGAAAKQTKAIGEKELVLRQMNADLVRKNNEFITKFNSDMKAQQLIAQLHALLDGEEHRLDEIVGEETDLSDLAPHHSPPKKRSRTDQLEEEEAAVQAAQSPEKKVRTEPEAADDAENEADAEDVVMEEAPVAAASEENADKAAVATSSEPKAVEVEVTDESAGAMQDEEEEIERSNLVSGSDAFGDYVTLCNASDVNYESMSGWRLQFGSTNFAFQFPTVALAAGDTFQIRMTASPPPQFGDDGRGGLVPVGTWTPAGDTAILYDPEDEVQAEFDIVPDTPVEDQTNDESGCHVM